MKHRSHLLAMLAHTILSASASVAGHARRNTMFTDYAGSQTFIDDSNPESGGGTNEAKAAVVGDQSVSGDKQEQAANPEGGTPQADASASANAGEGGNAIKDPPSGTEQQS